MVDIINQRFDRLPDWAKWMTIPTYFVIGVVIVALYPFYALLATIKTHQFKRGEKENAKL